MAALRDVLNYRPVELKFGTSGRRGLVTDLTQLEIYLNLRGELDFLVELSAAEGGIPPGATIFVGHDLRPSSTSFATEYSNRGELAQVALRAISDAGMKPVLVGALPTPVLSAYALDHGCASVMITGSHIPFDRNGYKLNTAAGELLKSHEPLIAAHTNHWREQLYSQSASDSIFNASGMLRVGHTPLPAHTTGAADAYISRLTTTFPGALAGASLLFYEHSSVGRDLIPTLLEALGAQVTRTGRSDVFVPIDTESLGADQLSYIQQLYTDATASGAHFDAVVSCDGDADRPLVLSTNGSSVEFISGDLLGMLAAEFLQPDAVVVPISCNPAIDESPLQTALRPKTKIGSPFVIAGMQQATAAGATRVCGWEANGGFLLGSDFTINGATLKALPTRDAALPIVAALLLAKSKGLTLREVVATLPQRLGATALLRDFPRERGQQLVQHWTSNPDELSTHFVPSPLTEIRSVDTTDGVRMYGADGDVLHLRPSGNADEFRIYAVGSSADRARTIAATAEPIVASLK